MNNNNSIPNHLIFEYILPKLPVKSLLRFKSVSKSWLSTISSPQFAKSHLKSSSSSSPLQFILLAGPNRAKGDEFHLLTYFDKNNNYDLKQFVELEFEDGYDSEVKSFRILGSCNGLVCIHVQLSSNEGYALFIGNPATRRFQKITIPEDLYLCSINCFVFYYESSTDDYKIFGLFSSLEGINGHFYVFSLSSGNWVRIGVLDNVVTTLDLDEVQFVLIDKAFYISFENEMEDTVVVGFDLITQQIKQLQSMNWVNNYISVGLSELRGCLLLLCSRHFNAVNHEEDDVWLLKDPNDMNSWEKLFSVNVHNVLYYGFSDNGKCLLHTEGKLRVFDPNLETPQMAQGGIAFDNGDSIVQSKSYIESLISPFR